MKFALWIKHVKKCSLFIFFRFWDLDNNPLRFDRFLTEYLWKTEFKKRAGSWQSAFFYVIIDPNFLLSEENLLSHFQAHFSENTPTWKKLIKLLRYRFCAFQDKTVPVILKSVEVVTSLWVILSEAKYWGVANEIYEEFAFLRLLVQYWASESRFAPQLGQTPLFAIGCSLSTPFIFFLPRCSVT